MVRMIVGIPAIPLTSEVKPSRPVGRTWLKLGPVLLHERQLPGSELVERVLIDVVNEGSKAMARQHHCERCTDVTGPTYYADVKRAVVFRMRTHDGRDLTNG